MIKTEIKCERCEDHIWIPVGADDSASCPDCSSKYFRLTGDFRTLEVRLNGKVLSAHESQKLCNHSPDGFNWGYGGSGAAQLALAVLLELFPPEIALSHYQSFKWEYIANIKRQNFNLTIPIPDYQ